VFLFVRISRLPVIWRDTRHSTCGVALIHPKSVALVPFHRASPPPPAQVSQSPSFSVNARNPHQVRTLLPRVLFVISPTAGEFIQPLLPCLLPRHSNNPLLPVLTVCQSAQIFFHLLIFFTHCPKISPELCPSSPNPVTHESS